jgi:hypothetical protein
MIPLSSVLGRLFIHPSVTGDTLQVSNFRHDSNLAPRQVVSGFSREVGLQRIVSFTVIRIPYDSYRGRQRRNHLPKIVSRWSTSHHVYLPPHADTRLPSIRSQYLSTSR